MPGTSKTHLAVAIARSCICFGARGRFYNVVDLVNNLKTETRTGSRTGSHVNRPDAVTPPPKVGVGAAVAAAVFSLLALLLALLKA